MKIIILALLLAGCGNSEYNPYYCDTKTGKYYISSNGMGSYDERGTCQVINSKILVNKD